MNSIKDHRCQTGAFGQSPVRNVIVGMIAWLASLAAPAVIWSNDLSLRNVSEGFSFEKQNDRLAISLGGRPVARFVFRDAKIRRPYFENLKLANGVQVTRNQPPIEGQDPTDHDTMHPGLWLAFGDVSGHDFWRNKGTLEHVGFDTEPTVKEGKLTFATQERFLAADGKRLGRMINRFVLTPLDGSGWMVIWDATITAEAQPMVFGDQEEMGFAARVATGINEKNGGRILSSESIQSAKQTWGQPADWCDYSGKIGDQPVGIMLMAGRENFRKSWWHNRDYGVFVANPFGRQAMKQGERSSIEVQPEKPLKLRFGAYLHEGTDIDFAEVFEQFETMQGL
jgi:hypothetical protein